MCPEPSMWEVLSIFVTLHSLWCFGFYATQSYNSVFHSLQTLCIFAWIRLFSISICRNLLLSFLAVFTRLPFLFTSIKFSFNYINGNGSALKFQTILWLSTPYKRPRSVLAKQSENVLRNCTLNTAFNVSTLLWKREIKRDTSQMILLRASAQIKVCCEMKRVKFRWEPQRTSVVKANMVEFLDESNYKNNIALTTSGYK